MRRLQISSTFYEALCEALLQADSERGLALYWHLQTVPMYVFTRDSNSEILLLDYALFNAPSKEIVQLAWQQKLEQSTTDQALLKVVIAAQSGQAKEWLWSYTIQALQADVPFMYMRAVTLLGLIDSEASREQLSDVQQQQQMITGRVLLDSLHADKEHDDGESLGTDLIKVTAWEPENLPVKVELAEMLRRLKKKFSRKELP